MRWSYIFLALTHCNDYKMWHPRSTDIKKIKISLSFYSCHRYHWTHIEGWQLNKLLASLVASRTYKNVCICFCLFVFYKKYNLLLLLLNPFIVAIVIILCYCALFPRLEIRVGVYKYERANIDGWVQERHNSSALAMELCFSCTNPLIYCMFVPSSYT